MEIALLILVGTALLVVLIFKFAFGPKEDQLVTKKLEQQLREKAEAKVSQTEGCGEGCSCVCKRTPQKVKILFGTQTGTSKEWANKLASEIEKKDFSTEVVDLALYDPDELSEESLILFVISTYTDGTPPESCAAFYEWLKDHSLDFRVSRNSYESVHYAVFGIGNSVYRKNFNSTGKEIDRMMRRLSAKRIVSVGSGDNGAGIEISEGFNKWINQLLPALSSLDLTAKGKTSDEIKTSDEFEDESEEEDEGEPLTDVEDIGSMMKSSKSKKKPTVEEEDSGDESAEDEAPLGPPKEMLTPSLRKALTKQGYRLLGSHSGVKMCRWTKAMLRGRGGCYKHTFYGIRSYQCMEMTPSLACANKCVFCWRHHKNPVGREWRWETDQPSELIKSAISNHQQMIKQLKGVPGVQLERWKEAFQVRHCALSLVGEPIIYPYINEFIEHLHERDISSFLVTNAQFPEKIDSIKLVTQMYVSVDAATKESMKQVDRPIFADFWERFLSSLDSLSRKGQRTVYRLTLIKGWNTEEMLNYAELVERGRPSFIEIKGVTYCGTSKASTLTMKNVPFHEEVLRFSEELCQMTQYLRDNYELACEHEHSCCVLLARKEFKIDGQWHTWIDYDKFHQLAKSKEPFVALDYVAPTPSWALAHSPQRGFDPQEVRFRRNKPYQGGGC